MARYEKPRGIRFPSSLEVRESAAMRESLLEPAVPSRFAKTLVYIHGIGNKPVASVLKKQWDEALFGVDLGQRSRMAYWVNRDYYPVPRSADVPEGERPPLDDPDSLAIQLHAENRSGDPFDESIEREAKSLARTDEQLRTLQSIAHQMQSNLLTSEAEAKMESLAAASDVHVEILPTEFLRRVVTRNITRAFLRDVNDFLYDETKRGRMEQSLRERLRAGGPYVVIAHSQGSLIAYSVLRELSKSDCDVRLLVTIGSPLGIEEVQDELIKLRGPLEVPRCVSRWVNVADRLDPVAVDVTLAEEYEPRSGVEIEDHYRLFLNPDSPRHPHSGTGYLKTPEVRKPVQEVVEPSFAAPVATFTVSRDVADAIEDQQPQQRINVLVELRQVEGVQGLDAQRRRVVEALESLPKFDAKAAELERLQRYVAVRLTRSEIEALADRIASLNLGRIWRDAEKTALVVDSCNTIHVRPAWESFGSFGEKIRWAVLDTGIAADHPHFHPVGRSTVEAQYDCTKWSPDGSVDSVPPGGFDDNGHGTHVAGIIAGKWEHRGEGESKVYQGMAPLASLVDYKVLNDAGRGRDSWIIKALQDIAAKNESAAELVIHGINLSLGGNFDPTVYACGHSPLCNELRRLWRQGVVVCIAAGNRGLMEIQTRAGFQQANLDLTIGDPANLEEAIAVGSVHNTNPFTYGVSYFSSRGPTADGRIKPDVIAPGEKILSANSRFKSPDSTDVDDLYVRLSGTSMAAPHISGMLAAFLSLRREYIGYPDQVKQILLDSCAPLGRDAYSEGRGLPSLMKMLSNA